MTTESPARPGRIDTGALRRRYAEERDKRLRPDGNDQYLRFTGATAVQCVPHLARDCRELYVFQRTPSSVDVRDNHPIDPDWFAEIATPGWQRRWLENFTANHAGLLQQRGPGLRRLPRPRLPLRPQRLLRLHRQVALIRHVRGAGVPVTTASARWATATM